MEPTSAENLLKKISEFGLSATYIKILYNNKELFSREKVTQILAENINLYTDYNALIDFLPYIWFEKNSSPFLLYYIAAIAHKLFYFVRDYPTSINNYREQAKDEIDITFNKLNKFRQLTSREAQHKKNKENEKRIEFSSAEQFLIYLKSISKINHKLFESLKIVGKLFVSFLQFPFQDLSNAEKLSVYLSRVFLLWKLNAITDVAMALILDILKKKINRDITFDKFYHELFLEFKNYQFLQLGIDNKLVEILVKFLLNQN